MEATFLEYRIYSARSSVLPKPFDVGLTERCFQMGISQSDERREMSRLRERKGCLSHDVMFPMRKRGMAYGARALWLRSLRNSPRTRKPSTWRREAGVLDAKIRRYA